MFDTVLIAGLGLMGGSMAKTIKARTLSRVLGWNRTRATAEQALADGSIDAIATEALYKEADLVIIGLYPQATVDWLLENMPKMKKGCVIVDMVGVKQFMVDHLEQAALDAGLQVLRYGGQLTQVGIFAKNATVDLGQLVYHDRSIVGSVAYDRETWMRTIRLVESARIDVKSFISETLPLSEWKRGFEKAAKREGFRILLLP